MSKYPKIRHCNKLCDCLIEVKYNKISQLGILNGDRVCLIEVKFTVNKGNGFWDFDNCPFNRGWLLNRGLNFETFAPQRARKFKASSFTSLKFHSFWLKGKGR